MRSRAARLTDRTTSPAFVRFYVDVRMPPQVRPVTIKYELDQVLEKLGIDYEMDIYKSLLGHERKNVEPLVRSAEEIYRYLFGERSALGIKRERAKEPRRDADLRTIGHHCLLGFATAVSIDDASFNPCLAKIPAF